MYNEGITKKCDIYRTGDWSGKKKEALAPLPLTTVKLLILCIISTSIISISLIHFFPFNHVHLHLPFFSSVSVPVVFSSFPSHFTSTLWKLAPPPPATRTASPSDDPDSIQIGNLGWTRRRRPTSCPLQPNI